MATVESTEARELSLVDKVELRIALADSDSKLQNLLNTYLPPLLLKLSSEHQSVRTKVISICQHLSVRLQSQDIIPPTQPLLDQFKTANQSPLVRHYDLQFLRQAVLRLKSGQLGALLPGIASGIGTCTSATGTQKASYFNLFMRSLVNFEFPLRGTPEETSIGLQFHLSDVDQDYLSSSVTKLLLYQMISSTENRSQPGLSDKDVEFISLGHSPDAWNPSTTGGISLTDAKRKALRFLAIENLFKPTQRLFPGIVASAAIDSQLKEQGKEVLKRALPDITLETGDLVECLFNMYLGYVAAPDLPTPAVPAAVRQQILLVLARTKRSTEYPERILGLVHRDLAPDSSESDPSSNARSAMRLRGAVVTYLHFFVRAASSEHVKFVARPIIHSLTALVDQDVDLTHATGAENMRGKMFEILGVLSSAETDVLFDADLSLLRWFFKALGNSADQQIVISVQEAMSSIIRSFSNRTDKSFESPLKEILISNLNQNVRNSKQMRYVTVRFANECLPFDDVVARRVNLLTGARPAEESHETVEEARKGLDPYVHRMNNSQNASAKGSENPFPPFVDLMHDLTAELPLQDASVLQLASNFCRQALVMEACAYGKCPLKVDIDWERKLDLALQQDASSRLALRDYFEVLANGTQSMRAAIDLLWNWYMQGLKTDRTQVQVASARFGLEFCAFVHPKHRRAVASQASAIQSAVFSNDIEVRTSAADCFGLLAASCFDSDSQVLQSLKDLCHRILDWKSARNTETNKLHGAILALAAFLSFNRQSKVRADHASELLQQVLPIVIEMLTESEDLRIYQAAFVALGQLCCYGVVTTADVTKYTELPKILEKLSKWAKAGNEKAIAAMGYIGMIIDESKDKADLDKIWSALYELHEVKQVETQFAVGEAITCLTSGWRSAAFVSKRDPGGEGEVPGMDRSTTLESILEKILTDCTTTKPSLKKACVVWLLSFLQFCSEEQEIQQRLPQLQAAFKRCLSDRDEVVQEAASRGLGLIYEKGSRELKDDLVRDLINSFSSERANVSGTVSADTELFEPGALPTGEGSVTTYRDIMSLATEIGDSSLVYRFMNLASNNAIWSSRAAFGRFGLSNVLSDSSVDGYLASNPKLYPKLFRYRFDPNPNVRRAMQAIWVALVKDPAKPVEMYFDNIVSDLIANTTAREWRTRQAACAALADVIQSRSLQMISPYLDRVWNAAFKVLDDIKETVRAAAAELTRVIINIITRALETTQGHSETAATMLKSILPFLLSPSGLESSAEDVQKTSLFALLEIIKKARPETLRPFIPGLVENLLALLTSLEPMDGGINYLYMNADKYKVTEQKIDDLRLKMVRSGPMMEAIERCLDMVDEETMKRLAVALQSALRSAIGMPSKVGCSRVLVSLSTRKNVLFRPYADQFLGLIPKYVSDRNDTVSSSYATALGYVARSSTDAALLKLAGFSRKLYFESEAEKSRIIAADMIQAIAKYATDRFAALGSEFLPFVFLAKNDSDGEVKRLFQTVWDDNTGGSRSASLYLSEIIGLAAELLNSNRWGLRHAAALAVAAAVEAVAASHGSIGEAQAAVLWPQLERAMADKTWEGKKDVLKGFVAFVQQAKVYWEVRPEVKAEIAKITLREAKRQNAAYRPEAMSALACVVADLGDLDLCRAAWEVGVSALGGKGDATRDEHQSALVQAAIRALWTAIGRMSEQVDADEAGSRVHRVLGLLADATRHDPPTLLAQFDALDRFFSGQHSRGSQSALSLAFLQHSEQASSVMALLAAALFVEFDAASPETLRLRRAQAILAYVKRLPVDVSSDDAASLRDSLVRLCSDEPSPAVRETLSSALQMALVARFESMQAHSNSPSLVRVGPFFSALDDVFRPKQMGATLQLQPNVSVAYSSARQRKRKREDASSDNSDEDRRRHRAGPTHPSLPPRSKQGCQTCRRRKVKCDEKRPICNQCRRLDKVCDYRQPYGFRDLTGKERSRPEVSESGCSVWDVTYCTRSYPLRRGVYDTLPPLAELPSNDSSREAKAAHYLPGKFFVVLVPPSFASLAEYSREDRPAPSEKGSRTSLAHDIVQSQSAQEDPDVLILERFEMPEDRPISDTGHSQSTSHQYPSPSSAGDSHPRPSQQGLQLAPHRPPPDTLYAPVASASQPLRPRIDPSFSLPAQQTQQQQPPPLPLAYYYDQVRYPPSQHHTPMMPPGYHPEPLQLYSAAAQPWSAPAAVGYNPSHHFSTGPYQATAGYAVLPQTRDTSTYVNMAEHGYPAYPQQTSQRASTGDHSEHVYMEQATAGTGWPQQHEQSYGSGTGADMHHQ